MWTAVLIFAVVAAVVAVAMRATGAASPQRHNRPADQPKPIDAGHERTPPSPAEDPGPRSRSGDPVPGSREDRERHGKP